MDVESASQNLADQDTRTLLMGLNRPSVDPAQHSLWEIDAAIALAERDTVAIRIERARRATLQLNQHVRIDELDIERLRRIIGDNHPPKPEVRSVWFEPTRPIHENSDAAPEPVQTLQVKGVVFDSGKPPMSYSGKGWPPRFAFANRDAVACVYDIPQEASGTCSVRESVNEFIMCREATQRMTGSRVRVPVPIGWGRFDEGSFGGEDFGFVILGLPKLALKREALYTQPMKTLVRNNDFTPMQTSLRLRGEAMRAMHQAGLLTPYRHFGNMSLLPSGEVFMHDLGDCRALTREHLMSDDQYATEAFIHLKYALTPADNVPKWSTPEEQVAVRNHIDRSTQTTLTAYYGEKSAVAATTLDELHEIFLASFDTPLSQIDNPFAQSHLRTMKKWLSAVQTAASVA